MCVDPKCGCETYFCLLIHFTFILTDIHWGGIEMYFWEERNLYINHKIHLWILHCAFIINETVLTPYISRYYGSQFMLDHCKYSKLGLGDMDQNSYPDIFCSNGDIRYQNDIFNKTGKKNKIKLFCFLSVFFLLNYNIAKQLQYNGLKVCTFNSTPQVFTNHLFRFRSCSMKHSCALTADIKQ